MTYNKLTLPILTGLRIFYGLICCFLFLISACNGQVKQQKVSKADTLLKGNFSVAVNLSFDSVEIDSFLKHHQDFLPFEADFRKLYRLHKYAYIWHDKNGTTEATSNLVNHLETRYSDGILNEIPYKDEFNQILNNLSSGTAKQPSALNELMFTAQYFNYAKNAWGGAQVNKAENMGWYLPKKKLDFSSLLLKQLNDSAGFTGQAAVVPQYLALKKQLNIYQKLEKSEEDIIIPYSNDLKNLAIGDTSAIIALLKKRLFQLGDIKVLSKPKHYDVELQNAIVSFKQRHGLTPNTDLTSNFAKAINIPIRKRIEQMLINLERMRWVPVDDHGGEFILVNIPEYTLHYYINNQLYWNCKVVVGKAMSKTVIFSGHLQTVVFSPYWYVPQSIIEKEIKPKMAKNPNYLTSQRMEWNGGHVRQKPGKANSLGLVKFIFPNSNNIYLHDTPSKPLFEEDERAFSHGCIRVAQPRELAITILKQIPSWTPEKIDAAMHSGVEKQVVLKNKIPVYIGYFTAFVNSKGELNFREDIYQRDVKLLNSLMTTK